MRPLLKFIRVCSQHNAAPEVKPAVNAYRDLGTLGKGGWGRKSRLIDWYTGSQRGEGRNGAKYWARGGGGGVFAGQPIFLIQSKIQISFYI
jgi:hypothetical protein